MTNATISTIAKGIRFALTSSQPRPIPSSESLKIKLKISITPQIPTPNITNILFMEPFS